MHRFKSPLMMSSLMSKPAMMVLPAPGSPAIRNRSGCSTCPGFVGITRNCGNRKFEINLGFFQLHVTNRRGLATRQVLARTSKRFGSLNCRHFCPDKWRIVMRKVMLFASVALVAFSASLAEAQGPGGGRPRGGFGGRPSFDTLLSAFDADGSGDLASDEVPGRVWYRLSQADSDGNGKVTRKEFESFGKPK